MNDPFFISITKLDNPSQMKNVTQMNFPKKIVCPSGDVRATQAWSALTRADGHTPKKSA